MTAFSFDVDVAIIGGGIGGLWLLNRLRTRGLNAVLLEKNALGSEQSVNSQGMIHGGIKYALGGSLTGASEAIAAMPDHWRRCLRDEGDVDLRGAQVLSDHFYLWSTETLTSRLAAFFGSKMTRGRVESVAPRERHPAFQNPAFRGNLYRLVDMVLDVPSVVQKLADNCAGRIYKIEALNFVRGGIGNENDGDVTAIQFQQMSGDTIEIRPRQIVLSAGAGNETLLQQLDCSKPVMQRRPLQQVLLKHDYPHALYAHCTGSNPSPRLTISSHPTCDGKWVWYLGGDLATSNADLNADALIAKAKQELRDLLPWLPFDNAQWATVCIDRAEPKQKGLIKPDKAFAAATDRCTNVIAAWPTKLTLAPNMADAVEALLDLQPRAAALPAACASLAAPVVATPCWDTLF
ncbi:MAG: FAD-dependent oxidoreductase [Spongiibacteraceae bacterium]